MGNARWLVGGLRGRRGVAAAALPSRRELGPREVLHAGTTRASGGSLRVHGDIILVFKLFCAAWLASRVSFRRSPIRRVPFAFSYFLLDNRS
jgi:hypothetical protein